MPVHDPGAIGDAETRHAYFLYQRQRAALRAHYARLPADQLACPEAGSPGEALASLVDTQLAYIGGLVGGRVRFAGGVRRWRDGGREALLGALDEADRLLFRALTSPRYRPDTVIETAYGPLRAVDLIHLMREHDVLRSGEQDSVEC